MPYRNSFVPEIDIIASNHETHTVLHITGQPVKSVRVFMAFWFGFSILMEAFLLIFAITSNLDSIIPVFIPLVLCLYGYLLCQLGTKAAFNTIIKAIKKSAHKYRISGSTQNDKSVLKMTGFFLFPYDKMQTPWRKKDHIWSGFQQSENLLNI